MTETNTQRGWEERLKSLQFSQNGIICPSCRIQDFVCRHCIRDFIATELTKAREEGFQQGKNYFRSLKIGENAEDVEKKAREDYRQELRTKVEGMKKPVSKVTSLMMKKGIFGKTLNDEINPMYHYNKAIDDLLTIISE